jgi:hypothetical protein
VDWLEFVAAMTGSLAWPAAAAVIALLFRRQIREALGQGGDRQLKRFKAGPIEAEWEARVQQALVDVAESTEADHGAQAGGMTPSTTLLERLGEIAQREPRAAVMAAYAEIEVALQQYLALAGYIGTARPMSARQLARAALSRQLISSEIADAIEGATVLRNLAAHGPGDEINREKAAEYLVLADAVLFAIEARREALENQQVLDT